MIGTYQEKITQQQLINSLFLLYGRSFTPFLFAFTRLDGRIHQFALMHP